METLERPEVFRPYSEDAEAEAAAYFGSHTTIVLIEIFEVYTLGVYSCSLLPV